MALTGRYDFRKTLTGRLKLQVEVEATSLWGRLIGKTTLCRRWRAATVLDLAAPELRGLIDLRFRSHFVLYGPGTDPNTLYRLPPEQADPPRALIYRPSGNPDG